MDCARAYRHVLLTGLTAFVLGLGPCSDALGQGWFDNFWRPARPQPPAPIPAPQVIRPTVPKKPAPKPAAKAEPSKDGTAALEETPPPYEPQLLRLAEILGALSYLRDICGSPDAAAWRGRMESLLDAETKTPLRREHLAGAFNRGFHGYELSYKTCTDNARVVIERFSREGETIAHDIANRYNAS